MSESSKYKKDLNELLSVIENGVVGYIQTVLASAGHKIDRDQARNILAHLSHKVLMDTLSRNIAKSDGEDYL